MLHSYLAAALRHLARSRLYATVSVCGLAVGICALALSLLVMRAEMGYERFVRDGDRAFLAITITRPGQHPARYQMNVPHTLAALLKLSFPEISAVARIRTETVSLEHEAMRANELIIWADPAFFDVMPLPVVAGDLTQALQRPDSIVLTRSAARKYFGQDAPRGGTLLLNRTQPLTVTAVIEDLPTNATELRTGIFVSSLLASSALARIDQQPVKPEEIPIDCTTYLRLAPGTSVERIRARLPQIAAAQFPIHPPGLDYELGLLRLDEAHVSPQLNPGVRTRVITLVGAGALILLIACINFINLSTARAARRAREIAIRKAAGASRSTLVVQFLGETLLYVLLATCLGMALVELLLPQLNAFLQTGAVLDYWREPVLLGWLALGILALTLLAGVYPAFVLAAFPPSSVLRGASAHTGRTGVTRRVLVTLQFALLIAMLVAAAIVYQQRTYALHEAVHLATGQHVLVETECRPEIADRVQAMSGVRHAGCINECLIRDNCIASVQLADGTPATYGSAYAAGGVLESLGVRPIAGRLLGDTPENQAVVINEQARLQFGFASAGEAIGRPVPDASTANRPRQIVGVVPDFSMASVEHAVGPTIYTNATGFADLLDVQLNGQQVPEVLATLDRLQPRYSPYDKLKRYFLDDRLARQYLPMLRMAQAFGAMSLVAVILACLGLVGLSAAATDRRTREIGIRKALGAERRDIVWLLVWQFTKPVIWAAIIAWPLTAWAMSRWLAGFAYHVPLTPFPFLGATAIALLTALLTVSVHSHAVACTRPVTALRHE